MFGRILGRRAMAGGGALLLLGRRAWAAEAEVVIDELEFRPAEIRVSVGTKVVWNNRDGSPHNVVSTERPALFRSGLMETGEKFDRVFATAGRFEYYCQLHLHMLGVVVVG